MEYRTTVEKIIDKISDKWQKLCKDFYICYSVKDLAYKISYELLEEYFGECNNAIYCKKLKDKWTIAIDFEQDIYFMFDIWWETGMYGDCGLHCGFGEFFGRLPNGYEDIEEVLPDEEEE